jgi:hypothetical protein
MAQEFSRRSIAGFVAGMVVATVLTVMGTFYVLHRSADQGRRPAAKPDRQVNERTPPHEIMGAGQS